MGTCCSKVDGKNKCASFNGALHHPSLEQWQAQISSCQFCQLNGLIAGNLQCCICGACRKSASSTPRFGVKGFATGGGSSNHEPRCSLCAADAYEMELARRAPRRAGGSQSSIPFDDEEDDDDLAGLVMDPMQSIDQSMKLDQYAPSRNCMENEGPSMLEDFVRGTLCARIKNDLLDLEGQQTLVGADGEMPPASRILTSSSKEGQDVIMLSNIAAYDFLSTSMRFARSVSIDDSDSIKLEVRYKHMLPHDLLPPSVNYVSVHNDCVHKRTRSFEMLLAEEAEANRSTRRRKSFQADLEDDERYKHGEAVMSDVNDNVMNNDEENDDDFHDITIGVSINSLQTDSGYTINGPAEDPEHCALSVHDSRHQTHGNIPMSTDSYVQDEVSYLTNCVDMLNMNVTEFNLEPVYLLSKENMQFISKEEKEWEVRAEAMGMEDKISRAQALSVVSTGDAIFFSGANAEEFHLIPSLFVQHPRSPVLSPSQENLNSPRLMGGKADQQAPEKSTLSVEDIIILLENDELKEDELFSLLIDTCTKSSPSLSPCSSSSSLSLSEAAKVWSSPFSSMLSSSSPSTVLSSVSSSTTSMPWSPSSSTSILQSPPSSTSCSSSLPYSLSLPASCKMSPHTSFEFKVKSSNSTPSTPVFSPIKSRTNRNVAQLKPNALTTGEIAEIWGLLEQRQACKQCA